LIGLNWSLIKIRVKIGGIGMALDKESLVHLICKRCDFYKESDKDLECGAYKILKGLLEKGLITPEQIIDASRE
jgi:hypothetical protein